MVLKPVRRLFQAKLKVSEKYVGSLTPAALAKSSRAFYAVVFFVVVFLVDFLGYAGIVWVLPLPVVAFKYLTLS